MFYCPDLMMIAMVVEYSMIDSLGHSCTTNTNLLYLSSQNLPCSHKASRSSSKMWQAAYQSLSLITIMEVIMKFGFLTCVKVQSSTLKKSKSE